MQRSMSSRVTHYGTCNVDINIHIKKLKINKIIQNNNCVDINFISYVLFWQERPTT